EFKKSRVLSENFEERYINALKSRFDLTTFLMGEIEAVEELYKREEEKRAQQEKEKTQKLNPKPNVADKVYEENKKRIEKYTRVNLNSSEADEDLERLLGGVREFINNYYPGLQYIYKERRHSNEGEKINYYANKFLSNYDYKGEVPISRQYVAAIERRPRDFKKIEFEHKFVIKETAFLLNELLDVLEKIVEKNEIPQPEHKIILEKSKSKDENWFYEYYNGLTYKEAFEKTKNFLKDMIQDFRFKDIKRNYSF
ncbi:MAG TPA: hypothetical protein PK771_11450, partial [Spirochaetota bacterium]|nr:hypothetical protein [Spirochaetota bacterium]